MKSLWKWFIGVATAIVAALFFFKKSKTTPKQEAPPSHEVTEVFVNQINEDLKEDLSKVDKATFFWSRRHWLCPQCQNALHRQKKFKENAELITQLARVGYCRMV